MRPDKISLFALVAMLIAILPIPPSTTPAAAQTKDDAAQFVFLPGTSVGMAAPSGFLQSKRFAGFEFAEAGSSILVVEFPPQAYGEMSTALTDTALAGKGITVKSRKPVTINGVKGLAISGTQSLNGVVFDKWIMLLGAETITAMISAQDPAGSTLNETNVMAAFASVRIRAPQSLEDKLAELPFSVGKLAGFRIVRTVSGNGVLLTKGPKDVVKDASQPVVIIVRPLGAPYPGNIKPSIVSEQLMRSIKSVTISSIGKLSEATVAGTAGHEMTGVATAASSGEAVSVTQWLQLEQGRQIRVVAIASADQSAALLRDLRAVASSLRIKD